MNPIFRHYLAEEENRQRQIELGLEKRLLRDRLEPLNLPNQEFRRLFRLNKEQYVNLVEELTPFLSVGQRSTKLSIETRVLAALRFFATGSYQKGVGEEHKIAMSQQAVSNTISEVATAIEFIAPRWIKFPTNEQRKQETKFQFMERFGFPGVLGAVDGTHVAIVRPAEDEHLYFNRKRYHSKNVQIICGANLEILNVNANFGGASHDAFIWRNSAVCRFLEENYLRGDRSWILGDSGYPQQPWLMTPIRNTVENTPERRYDNALTLARNTVERCIGVLKMRWRCLTKERVLRYTPLKAGTIINACCVLHNMCIVGNVPLEEEGNVDDDIENGPPERDYFQNIQEGQRQRRDLINIYFLQ